MPQTTALSDLKELQEQLDETDRALLKALEKRFELCREMTAAKLENNVGVMQPVEIDQAWIVARQELRATRSARRSHRSFRRGWTRV